MGRAAHHRLSGACAAALGMAAVVSACSGAQPAASTSGQFTTGPARAELSAYGQTFRPCTGLEVEGYPGQITRPSSQYYQGPWCTTVSGSTVYLWAFARTPKQTMTDAQIANEVNLDVDQMRRDLEAEGYSRVCGNVAADGETDEGFERQGATMAIRLMSSGQPQPRSSSASAATGASAAASAAVADPLALRVVLSPSTHRTAVEADGVGPPC